MKKLCENCRHNFDPLIVYAQPFCKIDKDNRNNDCKFYKSKWWRFWEKWEWLKIINTTNWDWWGEK